MKPVFLRHFFLRFFKTFLFLALFTGSTQASILGRSPRLALVWWGPGACTSCKIDAALTAKLAGFSVIRIQPGFKNFSLFNRASVWIQPGGKSTTAAQSMGPPLLEQIRTFVSSGGGYVGYCAGAFLATAQIGTSGKTGLGIIPGSTELYLKDDPPSQLLRVSTPRGSRLMYYAGGPKLSISESDQKLYQVRIIGAYAKDQSIAAVTSYYGKGKVAVSGFHPEQNGFWKLIRRMGDRDGSDRPYAMRMIRFAAKP